jgi:basic amino acid/polyamine antiporter, APA family
MSTPLLALSVQLKFQSARIGDGADGKANELMVAARNESAARLRREVGLGGAVLLGLGSILGTGVFVSLAIAAGVTGPSVVLAVLLGAFVATFNGLSSAQLAANHAVSGGTYEYGYRWLNSWLGFTAGWMFLCAKSASAATASLGLADYLLAAFSGRPRRSCVTRSQPLRL